MVRVFLCFVLALGILKGADNSQDNTYVGYDYSQTITSDTEKRGISIQFYLAGTEVGYRYNEVVLGSKKPLTQTIKFSNEYVPVTKEQRDFLANKLIQAHVFGLKSDEINDKKSDFSSLDIQIGKNDKQQFLFNTPPSSDLRKRIHEIIFDFVKELKIDQPTDREKATQTSEGDTIPAHPVSLAEVLAHPDQFSGKRISVVGFYHDEFEGINLAIDQQASKSGDTKQSVWFGEFSAFANQLRIIKSDSWIRVEGIFVQGPEGHMGMWPGSIERITHTEPVAAPK